MRKLNAKGFAHWIVPAVVVAIVGGIGAYMLTQSHADYVITGPVPYGICQQMGRKWDSTAQKCSNTCISYANGNYLVTSRAYNYCKGNISFISQSTCNALHRVYVYYVDGCSRRNEQTNITQKNPSPWQCQGNYARYVVASPNDKCDTFYYPTGK